MASSISDRVNHLLNDFVDRGLYAGVSVLASRDGQELFRGAAGVLNIEDKIPMTPESIVRIYSITKIFTAIAALTFLEEGKFDLLDPVTEYLPEFRRCQVLTGGTPAVPELRDLLRPITILDLFRHTAGFPYPVPGSVNELFYQQAQVLESTSLTDKIDRLTRIPLTRDPGRHFDYGYGTDILARTLEIISGQSFETVLAERIYEPLNLRETGFIVPAEKLGRLASIHEGGALSGPLRLATAVPGEIERGKWRHAMGGTGLYSTLEELKRLGELLCAGGVYGGKQRLGRKTIELMAANHLSGTALPYHTFDPGSGFGLGISVRTDLGQADHSDSVGSLGWGGLASTSFRVDPQERLVIIIFAQHFPYDAHRLFSRVRNIIYSVL